MKTTAGVRHKSQGFTLLELVVVMCVMMLMIGLGLVSFRYFDDKDPFEEPAAKLSQMSKFALHSAALRHQVQVIGFDKTGFSLLGASEGQGAHFAVPGDMKIMIYRWGGKTWSKAEGHTWNFSEQGICEPIKVRFEGAEGFRELVFHPLTGNPVDL